MKCPKSDEHMEVMNDVVEWWDNDQNHLYREIDCSGAKSHTPMWEHPPPPPPPFSLTVAASFIIRWMHHFLLAFMTAGIRILLDHMNKVTW